ncbi:hypothetical protein H8F21_13715 [Pseudomonas sp. P66]|uniref:Uncharacterized protein n=1 Tax=Pseudomonas arcuscaelestis TaxID=2710591 RepID=A0ABS2BYC8_9PSED|nr:hypothetical protein [Pseudomonas arcuscaelestis]MBM5458622.1 hypothetical protein [Pseudomonas arcuscaelestis]
MTDKNPKMYAEPFNVSRLGGELARIVKDQLDFLGPRLVVGADRATFTPGFAFEGLVGNAYRKRSLTKLSAGPSGESWFSIVMDATGDKWTVDYLLGTDNLVRVVTPSAEFNWVHETRGLAEIVIRPLFVDWVLRRGLIREYGEDYSDHLIGDAMFGRYTRSIARLYSKFGIQCR